jgi:tellurium resistance protein TerZ
MVNLKKGEKINLSKSNPKSDLSKITIGLGWSGKNGKVIDLDSYVGLIKENEKELIYFGKLYTSGITHNGDDLTGGGRSNLPNETIDIIKDNLPSDTKELECGLFTYTLGKNFKDVVDAFISITDKNGKELVRYELSDFGKSKSLVAGKFFISNGEISFEAVGEASNNPLSKIQKRFSTNSGSFLSRIF